jgi:hypothetical protein
LTFPLETALITSVISLSLPRSSSNPALFIYTKAAFAPIHVGAEFLCVVLAAIAKPVRRAWPASGRAWAAPGQDSGARGCANPAAAPDPAGVSAL